MQTAFLASSARKPPLGALLLAFALLQPAPVPAQEKAEAAASESQDGDINGFAETWRSTAAPTKKAPSAAAAKARTDSGDIPEIDMFVGETRVFPAPAVARVAVGNGRLMSAASLDDKEVIVFANAAGTSSLFIWNKDGRYRRLKINIVPGDTSRFAREIAAFLASIPNARASVIGDKVIVEGDELSDHDLTKIDELAKRYPQIVNFTNRVGWDQMVLLDVKVVEFPTNELSEIGLKWTAAGGAAIGAIGAPIIEGKHAPEYQINLSTVGDSAPITAAGGGTQGIPLHRSLTLLGMVNLGLNAQLNLLAQEGRATILAEPQLSARNGTEALFLAGGEYPYVVSTVNGPTVNFKPYGIRLKITPQVSRSGIVRAKIESEVSAIDASVATTAGPALTSRKTSTEFNVRNGDTLVLAGLLTRKNSLSLDKVPLLGDLPVLGPLFRSRRFQNDETELVVFVTPTIVDSRTPSLVDRIERTGRKLEENLGRSPYLSNPIQPDRDPGQPGKPDPATPGAAKPAEPPAPASPQARTAPGPATAGSAAVPLTVDPLVGRRFRVRSNRLALRSGPDAAEPVLARLPIGSEVEAMSKSADGNWLAVQIQDQWGWVALQHLAPPAAKAH